MGVYGAELLRCPKCGYYMYMNIDYNNAMPIVWHKCENCGHDNKNIWEDFETTNKTNYKE